MYPGYEDSPAESERSSGKHVWKDTSAEELYGSYLDGNVDMQSRPTMANRMTAAGIMGGAAGNSHPDITVGLLDENETKKKEYSGRKKVWPGALFLLLVTAGALAAITYFAIDKYDKAQTQQDLSEAISTPNIAKKTIPIKICELPNYVTDKGKLYATGGDDNKKVEVRFTGINWSGMENVEGVPHGLATGQSDLDTIAAKLNKMEINAVRLPLNAKMIIENSAPDTTKFVSRLAADLNVGTYVDMIKKIVQGLAKQQIAVLLDLHKIDPEFKDDTSEHLWYTDAYPEAQIIKMFQSLASDLCNDLHYNIIGIDIKNEPVGGCWPADDSDAYCSSATNWPRAVERIGAAILEVCPNWLIVVEGLYAQNQVKEINGNNMTYSDWYGASLQNATKNPIKLTPSNKIVFAPHFYSPSVYPAAYFFAKQSTAATGAVTIEEYPNTTAGNALLKTALTTVLDEAFGNVMTESGIPAFYGEFGGIYGAAEILAGKTSTRVIDLLIEYADSKGMVGGFSWALNPDGEYAFNDVYVQKAADDWHFGLYADSKWSKYNDDYATGLKQLK
uniref:Glycoside hydrolase family 5 domain-containing protein n=1 Tax=Globisporangium ultimum (strain ATCC 200006 / CBS 805.95 / DAOM BR144) TaxID=431595 RepID=K3WC96_GLOUD